MTLEAFLARLYGSPAEVAEFLRAPEVYAAAVGLDPEQRAAVLAIDPAALRFAALSYERKRRGHKPVPR